MYLKAFLLTFVISCSVLSLKAQNSIERLQNLNNISKIIIAKDKSIWAGNKVGYILHFNKYGKFVEQFFLGNTFILGLEQSKEGTLFATTDIDLYTFEDGKWIKSNLLQKTIWQTLIRDNKNNIYLHIEGEGIYKFENNSWKYIFKDYVPSKRTSFKIYNIFEDHKKNIWVCTSNGLDKFDGKTWEYQVQKNISADCGNVLQIIEDNKGIMYFNTVNAGLVKYDGNSWQDINIKRAFNGDYTFKNWEIRDLFINTKSQKPNCIEKGYGLFQLEGSIWKHDTTSMKKLGLFNGNLAQDSTILYIPSERGIIKFEGKKASYITTENSLLSNEISAIFVDSKEKVWIASKLEYACSGIDCITKDSWIKHSDLTTSSKKRFMAINSISEDFKGNIWVGNGDEHGISKFNGISWSENTNDVPDRIYCVFHDSKSNVWVGHRSGFSKYDGLKWTYIKPAKLNEPASDDIIQAWLSINSITEDTKGNIWMGTRVGGLIKYNTKDVKTMYEKNSNIPNNKIDGVYKNVNGGIYVRIKSELYTYDETSWKSIPMPKGYITIITQDKYNNLFLLTQIGTIYQLINDEWHLVSAEGLVNYFDSQSVSCFTVDKSNFWIGTINYGVLKIKR